MSDIERTGGDDVRRVREPADATGAPRRLHRRTVLAALAIGGIGCGSTSTPTRPTIEDASTFFPSGDVMLHYALDLPTGAGPFPAVVVGHGSGQTTKDEGAAHVPFLRDRGFAVLRYDKRGVGRSTGTYRGVSVANSETQVPELAGDMVAGVRFLQGRPEIDGRRVGLMGVSQAGWIMIEAASRAPDIRFFVAVVGSVMAIGQNVFYENLPKTIALDAAYDELRAFDGPRGWDPVPVLRAIRTPAIWLLGAEDRLVPTRECQRVLAELGTGAPFRTIVYPSADHSLSGQGTRYWPDVFGWMSSNGLP
ncbi:MAG: prolyl oligopeptidase family serine peptidase [Vicinamibacterales bacterium]